MSRRFFRISPRGFTDFRGITFSLTRILKENPFPKLGSRNRRYYCPLRLFWAYPVLPGSVSGILGARWVCYSSRFRDLEIQWFTKENWVILHWKMMQNLISKSRTIAFVSSCWGLQTSSGLAPKLRRALKRTSTSSYNPKCDLGAGLHCKYNGKWPGGQKRSDFPGGYAQNGF